MAETAESVDAEVLAPVEPYNRAAAFPYPWDVFAAHVALGESYAEAARKAGYSVVYADRLMRNPAVIERVRELATTRQIDSANGVVSRIWIEMQLVTIFQQNLELEKPDLDLARRTLMDVAKLRGFIVERKASVHLQKQVGKSDLDQILESYLRELAPNEAETLRKLSRGKGKIAKLAE